MADFGDMARDIIESNRYMVLGTAGEAGVPWVTPVWYAQSDYRRFMWVSSPDRAVFDTAGQAQGLTRRWALEDVRAPAPYRLYRATVAQHWVLDPDSSPDARADVTL